MTEPAQKMFRQVHLLKQPVFVLFLMLGFLGVECSLLIVVGDGSRGLKSSMVGPSGAIATDSISRDERFQGSDLVTM